MKRVAFIYPGQGSQQVGMGKELLETYSLVKALFDQADQALQTPLSELMLQGPEEQLTETRNAQPALLLMSTAVTKVLADQNIVPDAVAGHSLGEYSALVAAGVFEWTDALQLVQKRGELMEQAYPAGAGAMAAVLGMEQHVLEQHLQKITEETNEPLEIANLNCPGQIVISGTKLSVETAAETLKEAGAKRVILLNVSGPFHSSLMKKAADEFTNQLENVNISDAQLPFYANVTANIAQDKEEIKQLLVKQLYSTVRFQEIIEQLLTEQYDAIVELGNGKVLTGLVKKINRRTKTFSIQDPASVQAFVEWYKEES
ncbi:[acyl-carrier-protein] S-malonyltransferase [Natronobacillus azotifigens]|uniref:Malonyl CoA-acyl carrier protein transacylase n=1 Tax=Natronobacillus azotifigens TaxID=472978 RepID=A0A9J6RCF6_9BACI|nr:ACP S-malonyltransferase [Natronobacillus azotifigens]MCZ0703394.1 ACP S-malonyltransferase [Natronobacillus azotifigens]